MRKSHRYFGPILSAIKREWGANIKRRSFKCHSRKKHLIVTGEEILRLGDRVEITRSHR